MILVLYGLSASIALNMEYTSIVVRKAPRHVNRGTRHTHPGRRGRLVLPDEENGMKSLPVELSLLI